LGKTWLFQGSLQLRLAERMAARALLVFLFTYHLLCGSYSVTYYACG
jgi:hypothetical protein